MQVQKVSRSFDQHWGKEGAGRLPWNTSSRKVNNNNTHICVSTFYHVLHAVNLRVFSRVWQQRKRCLKCFVSSTQTLSRLKKKTSFVLHLLCFTFTLFYIYFVLHLLVMSRFWPQVAPPPSPVSSQGLLCSTTAVPQTVASFSGFSSSCDKLFSYFIHQVWLLSASDHKCCSEERFAASHLLHASLLLSARTTEYSSTREAVPLPMPTLQWSARVGSSTLFSQMW